MTTGTGNSVANWNVTKWNCKYACDLTSAILCFIDQWSHFFITTVSANSRCTRYLLKSDGIEQMLIITDSQEFWPSKHPPWPHYHNLGSWQLVHIYDRMQWLTITWLPRWPYLCTASPSLAMPSSYPSSLSLTCISHIPLHILTNLPLKPHAPSCSLPHLAAAIKLPASLGLATSCQFPYWSGCWKPARSCFAKRYGIQLVMATMTAIAKWCSCTLIASFSDRNSGSNCHHKLRTTFIARWASESLWYNNRQLHPYL